MNNSHCPATALFNISLTNFCRSLEKAYVMHKNFRETKCFSGRIQENIRKRQEQATDDIGQVLEISGYEQVSISTNYGEVLICEAGNDKYRESTVIGTTVNVAARMEFRIC